jgi:uncharacterized DUF497 family protein
MRKKGDNRLQIIKHDNMHLQNDTRQSDAGKVHKMDKLSIVYVKREKESLKTAISDMDILSC